MSEDDEEIAVCAKKEEILAAGQYDEHLSKAKDPKLRRILKANRDDEITDHAQKLHNYVVEEEYGEHAKKKNKT